MRKLLVILFAFISSCAFAKGAQDMYIMWNQPTYNQIYIYEQEIKKIKSNNHYFFAYDISYIDSSLYTTYHFSIIEPQIVELDSIAFDMGQYHLVYSSIEQLYIDKVKHGWLHRYVLSVTLEDIQAMYHPTHPLLITAYTRQGKINYLPRSVKKWKKCCNNMQQIFMIIQLNQK